MKVYQGVDSIDGVMRGAVLTVGNFDGVHLGHQRIMRTAHALAQVSSTAVLVMTFEPHPLSVLRPDHAPEILTPWEEKIHQLESAGVDAVVRVETNRSVLSLSPEAFVREILVKRIHPSYIVEGPDFGFGRGRAGNCELLSKLSAKGGYQVRVVEPYRLSRRMGEHVVVSSTVIRGALRAGRVEEAMACLGRPYSLVGKVVRGAGAGKKLGYPTINLAVGRQLVPAEGVYAGVADIAGRRGPSAISIGRRPTLGGTSLVIEAFVLDDSGDWYDVEARLDFVGRLRDQVKFDSQEALTEQIAKDVAAVRAIESKGC